MNIDFESVEIFLGTIGSEGEKIFNIITTDKLSEARKLIGDTTEVPFGQDPRSWRRRERGMKFRLWALANVIKRIINGTFNGLVHILKYFGSSMS